MAFYWQCLLFFSSSSKVYNSPLLRAFLLTEIHAKRCSFLCGTSQSFIFHKLEFKRIHFTQQTQRAFKLDEVFFFWYYCHEWFIPSHAILFGHIHIIQPISLFNIIIFSVAVLEYGKTWPFFYMITKKIHIFDLSLLGVFLCISFKLRYNQNHSNRIIRYHYLCESKNRYHKMKA